MSLLCYLLQYKLLFSVLHHVVSVFISFVFTLHRTQRWKITWINHLPMYRLQYIPPKNLPLSEEKSPSPQHLSKLVNKNTILNLNIAYYFLNILASPDEFTWSTTGVPVHKTIKHICLTRQHWHKLERTWHMVNKCKEMEQQYTGNNYVRRYLNPPYLVLNLDEKNSCRFNGKQTWHQVHNPDHQLSSQPERFWCSV